MFHVVFHTEMDGTYPCLAHPHTQAVGVQDMLCTVTLPLLPDMAGIPKPGLIGCSVIFTLKLKIKKFAYIIGLVYNRRLGFRIGHQISCLPYSAFELPLEDAGLVALLRITDW